MFLRSEHLSLVRSMILKPEALSRVFCVERAERLGYEGRMIYGCTVASLHKNVQARLQGVLLGPCCSPDMGMSRLRSRLEPLKPRLKRLTIRPLVISTGEDKAASVKLLQPGSTRPYPMIPAVTPPTMVNSAPVTHFDSSEARKRSIWATSSGVPIPIGWMAFILLMYSSSDIP